LYAYLAYPVRVNMLLIRPSHIHSASCYFISLRSRCSPEHSVLNHPQSLFFPSSSSSYMALRPVTGLGLLL
jgi:hypothetical protein